MKYRIEKDSLGNVKVPEDALWGAQTQRALENFKISGIKFAFPFGRSFIEALGIIKFSAAAANQKLKLLSAKKANAIKSAAKTVIIGEHDDSFPLDVFQTGSGTSTNMNANEVIANIASKKSKVDIPELSFQPDNESFPSFASKPNAIFFGNFLQAFFKKFLSLMAALPKITLSTPISAYS